MEASSLPAPVQSEGYKGASELSLGSSDLGLSTCSLEVNYSQSLQDTEELDQEAQELDANKMEPRSGEAAIEPDLENGDEWIFRIHTVRRQRQVFLPLVHSTNGRYDQCCADHMGVCH
ncbi:uncharacterized protein LOC133777180 isoform X2 [Lepus europaeus]|uniref:uncharacterized protein LOC133777180 isoform X2 n=1 Tax=Lepus europaeus TaxID=9983 RepID=UPI002B459219|nr:uncharacterized protein LOC133777180 isoform X2 [Lepus europaeus]